MSIQTEKQDIKWPWPSRGQTIDPTSISGPSDIPPKKAKYAGLSPEKQVDVYYGTLKGDIDAEPSAKELLNTAPDTGGVSNADYVNDQLSKIYGGAQLPSFQSPNKNDVKSVVFVSGSKQGPFGAFHIDGSGQADFDRIVVDSLNASGNYSSSSGLPSALRPSKQKRAFAASPWETYRGPGGLLHVTDVKDPALRRAKKTDILSVLPMSQQNEWALLVARITGQVSKIGENPLDGINYKDLKKTELAELLVRANTNAQRLLQNIVAASPGRQYLSTALFAAELTECFQTQTNSALPGQTDGEGLSRVLAFKLTPEIALVSGFNSAVTQQWWQDKHPDWVNDNSQSDQSTDGNAAGVMFLLFLNDYLGVPMSQIVKHMPQGGGPLGQTYANLLKDNPGLAQAAGADGKAAFQKMISLLVKNSQNQNGTLNLPANGNPFTNMPGAKSGGLA